MVVLARLIPPSAFGMFAIAVIVQEIAINVPSEGVGIAIVQRRSVEREHLQGGLALSLLIGARAWRRVTLAARGGRRAPGVRRRDGPARRPHDALVPDRRDRRPAAGRAAPATRLPPPVAAGPHAERRARADLDRVRRRVRPRRRRPRARRHRRSWSRCSSLALVFAPVPLPRWRGHAAARPAALRRPGGARRRSRGSASATATTRSSARASARRRPASTGAASSSRSSTRPRSAR